MPSVPDPGASIRALPKKRPTLPPAPPVKRRKLILPDPEYVSSGGPSTSVSEVDSLFEDTERSGVSVGGVSAVYGDPSVYGDTSSVHNDASPVHNDASPVYSNTPIHPNTLPTHSTIAATAPHSDIIPTHSNLIPTHSKLPQLYWKMIPYEYFNRIQSATVDTLLSSDTNVVVSAPTVASPPS